MRKKRIKKERKGDKKEIRETKKGEEEGRTRRGRDKKRGKEREKTWGQGTKKENI